MSLLPDWPPKDLTHFCIHGFCGLIVGAILGLGAYAQSPFHLDTESWTPLLLHIGIGALIFGLIAGFYGDELWKNFKDFWL